MTAFCIVVRPPLAILRSSALVLMALLLGLGWGAWHAERRLAERLPVGVEGRTVTVSGYLCDTPTPGSFRSLRFSFCVTQWHDLSDAPSAESSAPRVLRLAWYRADDAGLPGHRLKLELALKRPHGALNDSGFRYEDWLFRNGFRATGTVRNAAPDPGVPCGIHCRYRQAHGRLIHWVETRFSGAEHFPLIASLLVGYRGYMTEAHWQVLKDTGTVHLVAISGLHLGLIALGAGIIGRRVLLVLPVTRIGESAQRRVLFALVTAACLVYALAAGFTVPTRRALVMVVVAGWTLLCARQMPPWHALVLAFAVVLLLDPFAPLDQGFWLSFGAVIVLIFAFAGGLGGSGWLPALVLSQCAVFAGLWPVLQAFGQGQPLIGALANMLAIPLVSLVVMPVLIAGSLLASILPSSLPLLLAVFDGLLEVLWTVLSNLAALDVPAMEAGAAEVVLFAALVLALVWTPSAALRWTGALLIAAWLFLGSNLMESEQTNPMLAEPRVRVWDVGQGLALMVRHKDKVLIYDTGPAVPGVFSSVQSILLPDLKALGIHRIDTLVVSHADSDHAGGLVELVQSVAVGRLVTGEVGAVREKLKDALIVPVIACREHSEAIGELRVSFWRAEGARTGNDASCVVRVEHRASGTEWILPGDITTGVERNYLAHLQASGALTAPVTRIVLAPHHGSRTSSSLAWAAALAPDVVIYSAGYRHRFGHPHPLVTARYRDVGGRALSTACSGMITLAIEANRLVINEKRFDSPFWIGAQGQARTECKIP